MIISTVAVAVTIPIYWFLAHAFGGRGIALAGSITAILLFAALTAFWTRRHGNRALAIEMVGTYAKALGGAVLAAGVVYFVKNALWKITLLHSFPVLVSNAGVALVAGIAGLAVGYGLLMAMGVEDVREILLKVARRAK